MTRRHVARLHKPVAYFCCQGVRQADVCVQTHRSREPAAPSAAPQPRKLTTSSASGWHLCASAAWKPKPLNKNAPPFFFLFFLGDEGGGDKRKAKKVVISRSSSASCNSHIPARNPTKKETRWSKRWKKPRCVKDAVTSSPRIPVRADNAVQMISIRSEVGKRPSSCPKVR